MADEKQPNRGPAKSEEERIARKRAAARRYRESHADEIREKLRQWKAANPDKVKEYAARFRDQHREQIRKENRDRERARAAKARKAEAARERRRVAARERYAADPEAHSEYQRERRRAQRAADPEGYREAKKQRNKRWRDGHRDEQNAKLRAKRRDNPEPKRAAAEKYYAEHGDKVRERRREYYWANHEKQLESQRRWRAAEKRRRDVGLPPRRLHRVLAAERAANHTEADEFFSRPRFRDEILAMRHGPRPTEAEIARLERDNERARAAHAFAMADDPTYPMTASDRRAVERARAAQRHQDAINAEEARLVAIARAINDQLRVEPRRSSPIGEAEPVQPISAPATRGISR